jgi:hypothetical protein
VPDLKTTVPAGPFLVPKNRPDRRFFSGSYLYKGRMKIQKQLCLIFLFRQNIGTPVEITPCQSNVYEAFLPHIPNRGSQNHDGKTIKASQSAYIRTMS